MKDNCYISVCYFKEARGGKRAKLIFVSDVVFTLNFLVGHNHLLSSGDARPWWPGQSCLRPTDLSGGPLWARVPLGLGKRLLDSELMREEKANEQNKY